MHEALSGSHRPKVVVLPTHYHTLTAMGFHLSSRTSRACWWAWATVEDGRGGGGRWSRLQPRDTVPALS